MMKSIIFRILLLSPIGFWIFSIFAGQLGAEPVKELNHQTGEVALYYLMLNLLLGILISWPVKFKPALRFLLAERRFLGVLNFVFLIAHVFFYFALEGFAFMALEQMWTKTYLIVATLAWLIMLVLTMTSNNFSVKKIGARNWKKLHQAVYVATILITVHVMLIEKTDLIKYGILFFILWSLQIIRFIRNYKKV